MAILAFGAKLGDEEFLSVKTSIDNAWMGMGPKSAEFEAKFSARLGRPFVLTNNCSNALHLAVRYLNLPPGSCIIVPSFTWAACANAVVLEGHVPVFADSELNGNVSLRTIKNVLTDRTKAIMVVHYAGLPVPMKEILALGLPVIEDAAHAVDSKLDGQYCGTFGDVAAFSFDPVKNLATPDMGGIAVNDPSLAKTLRHCGIPSTGFDSSTNDPRWWDQDVQFAFPKYTPNDIAASIGLVQLEKLPEHQQRRKELWDIYQGALDLDWIVNPADPPYHVQHSYFTYLVRVACGQRDGLARYLKEQGIYTTLRFRPLHTCSAFRQYNRCLPGCDTLEKEGLNLPLHPRMTDDDVYKVIEAIKDYEGIWTRAK